MFPEVVTVESERLRMPAFETVTPDVSLAEVVIAKFDLVALPPLCESADVADSVVAGLELLGVVVAVGLVVVVVTVLIDVSVGVVAVVLATDVVPVLLDVPDVLVVAVVSAGF